MKKEIRELLLSVDKPSRYCGGEYNTPNIKTGAALRYLMCFPDVYEVAMSNLGIKILYHLLNKREDTACESCYAPWPDMGQALQSRDIDLFSLETTSPMREFNMIGFSMQYEMSYTNVLYMLKLGKIPLYSKDRGEDCPIIMAGGPCVVNPMPIENFIDLFSIGDGENTLNELAETYVQNKKSGGKRADFLLAASKIEGVYVPSIMQKNIHRAVIDSLDDAFYPTSVQIPNIEAVHNRAVLEIFRGCTRGCRFCQAGIIYRPVRERTVPTLLKYAKELIENNGFDELSLSSLSTCDYPNLRELLVQLKPIAEKNKVSLALPSTRVDSFEADFVDNTRKSSLTFAPEAGTQRLRDVINKNITEEDVLTSMGYAFEKGYSSVKLYFMIGLPTETFEDIEGIPALAAKVKKCYRERSTSKQQLKLSISTSTFVPKPFTPFQWERQISLEEIREKQNYLREQLKRMGIKYSWHDSKTSQIEAVFARGDARLNAVIYSAFNKGCIFDSWDEHFCYEKWTEAFDENGVDISYYTDGFDIDGDLPWEKINVGVSKEFLLSERKKAYDAVTTPDCRGDCHNCGINLKYKSAFKKNCLKGEAN